MRKRRKNSRLHKSTIAIFAVAGVLLAGSAIGSTRAALTYYSDHYSAQLRTQEIGTALMENGEDVTSKEGSALLGHLQEQEIKLGKAYQEELSVTNTGDIDQYVRVRIYKSWTDEEGSKDPTLSPSYIDLNLNPEGGWIEDEGAATAERSVWYYTEPLAPEAVTTLLTDTIRIDQQVASKVKTETKVVDGSQVTTTVYAYDGYTFHVKAEVDAVQNHNAADAMKSAWGVDVTVDGNKITAVE